VCVNRTQARVNRTQVCVNRTQARVNRTQDLASLERGEAAAPQPTFTIPLKPHVSAELADGATLSRVLHQVSSKPSRLVG
jgi:hypothetical protein